MSTAELSSVSIVAADILAAPAKRRARGTGSVREDKKRGLFIATTPRVPGQAFKTFYGKTQKEALEKLDEYRRDVASGRISQEGRAQLAELSRNPKVGEWLTWWIENKIKPRYDAKGNREGGKQPTTYENYRFMANRHILPYPIARVQLDKLTVGAVEAWWQALTSKDVGMPSRYKALVVLQAAIKAAIVRQDVTRLQMNPANIFSANDSVRKPRAEEKPAPKPEEVRALFEAARGERLELVVHLGSRLGLRRQELTALRFGDFDFERNVLHIRRRVNRVKVEGLAAVLVRDGVKMKDESAEDTVPLEQPELWKQLLAEHREQLVAFRIVSNKTWRGPEPTTPWGWLFPTRTGEVMDPNEVYRWFKGIAAKAGQPNKRLHDLRHDCASMGISNGMSLWEVSKLLRHSSTNVTESVYGHIQGHAERQLFSTVDTVLDAMLEAPAGDAATG